MIYEEGKYEKNREDGDGGIIVLINDEWFWFYRNNK